ncbi:MAG TPA: glycine cleavage T C-terminal barrel domain-containing protein, partial [Steroidobacteraceae bacterium]|nr:glycine cleavage T C-terminal barrel domain-containing protein [Steroidobacteraceae bacterium]
LSALRRRGNRTQLVGFELENADAPLLECHLVIDAGEIAGRITSVAWSAALRKRIGLAQVSPALAAHGTPIRIRDDDGAMHAARVVPLPFYDPESARQKHGAVT